MIDRGNYLKELQKKKNKQTKEAKRAGRKMQNRWTEVDRKNKYGS